MLMVHDGEPQGTLTLIAVCSGVLVSILLLLLIIYLLRSRKNTNEIEKDSIEKGQPKLATEKTPTFTYIDYGVHPNSEARKK